MWYLATIGRFKVDRSRSRSHTKLGHTVYLNINQHLPTFLLYRDINALDNPLYRTAHPQHTAHTTKPCPPPHSVSSILLPIFSPLFFKQFSSPHRVWKTWHNKSILISALSLLFIKLDIYNPDPLLQSLGSYIWLGNMPRAHQTTIASSACYVFLQQFFK